ncbi:MAG: InlB B-repeat-containing protein, partial [Defluviitaleaceae bacterium]|nr:InlB B-repeat-containing protein [Defluviitaleaceae bacterium]
MKKNIKRIAIMFAFLLLAVAVPLWAYVSDGTPYDQGQEQDQEQGQEQAHPGRGRDIVIDSDYDANYVQDDTYYCDYSPIQDDNSLQRESNIAVETVNISSAPFGMTSITIPGHDDVDSMAFLTDYGTEFFVIPPHGTYFSPETALAVSGDIQITFGPVVRGDGRLFFIISTIVEDDTDTGHYEPEAPPTVDIIFYAGSGLMPYGESGSMTGPVGLHVDNAPTPHPPNGYVFVGWQHNGIRVDFPFNAAGSMTLNAIYERAPVGDAAGTTFTLTFWPAGGNMPPGEPASRSLPINTALNQLPTPTRDGHAFGGWLDGHALATTPVILTSNTELTAVWVRLATATPAPTNQDTTPASATTTSANTQASETTNNEPAVYAAIFDPTPGTFASGETGLRTGTYGTHISNIPKPLLNGYIFIDWRLANGQTLTGDLVLNEDTRLTAIWVASASPSPSPTPNPTSTPGVGGASTHNNPQTSPIQVSLMIFGTIMIAAISALSIMKISRKQMATAEAYRSNIARYNREKRIMDLVDD